MLQYLPIYLLGMALQYITTNKDVTRGQAESFLDLVLDLKNKGWVQDDILPKGWKVNTQTKGAQNCIPLMSQDQQEFDSVLSAFLHLVKENAEDIVLEKFRMKLLEEGWEENKELPNGWLITKTRGESLFELLSREGVLHQTLDGAHAFMESAGEEEYSGEDRLGVEEVCMEIVEVYLANMVATNSYFNKHVNKFTEPRKRKRREVKASTAKKPKPVSSFCGVPLK